MHIAVAGKYRKRKDPDKTPFQTLRVGSRAWRSSWQSVSDRFYEDMHRWSFNLQIFSFPEPAFIGDRWDPENRANSDSGPYYIRGRLHICHQPACHGFDVHTRFWQLHQAVPADDIIDTCTWSDYIPEGFCSPRLLNVSRKEAGIWKIPLRLDYLYRAEWTVWIMDQRIRGPKLILEVDNLQVEDNPGRFQRSDW